jgi:SAM-dependent methyltransferase
MLNIHRSAASGFAKGAATYVKGRPDYPPEVEDWLRGDLALSKGKTVLDLGAGTGKFIPSLRTTDAELIAVEPVAAMLAQLVDLNPGIIRRNGGGCFPPMDFGPLLERRFRECQQFCVRGRFDHHAVTNLSSKMMAN